MNKHTAIYARVSSRKQDVNSQLSDLENWATTHDGEVRWFRDEFTGKTMHRPGWSDLYGNLQAGLVSTVVVWRLDRLGRTAKGLTAVFEELSQRRVGLISLRDGLDLSTAAGRLMANVLASVAQFETEIRAERVMAGQAAARAKGKKWGGSKPGTRRTVSQEKIEIIRDLKSKQKSIAAIARAVNLSRPTIYRLLAVTEK